MQKALPTSSKHKPIYALPYYARDGQYANSTDCHFLSLGKAQYDPNSFSAKAFRSTSGEKWNRNSEELPIHRVLDMAILIAKAAQAKPGEPVAIPSDGVAECVDPATAGELVDFLRHDPHVTSRLRELRAILEAR